MDLKFDFCFNTEVSKSFRSDLLISQYDLESKNIVQEFKGDHKLPDKWNIGLICGGSGTGKTSIAKQVFKNIDMPKWDDKPIIENFDKSKSMDEITYCLGSVGFNSVPYWLKKYSVLSNGERSRVDLARMLCENDEISVFDEFTSVVDRTVAKSMANSVSKSFKKLNKKIVMLSCHKDIIEWLSPDWVYDTDQKRFFFIKTKEKSESNLKLNDVQNKSGKFIKNITI